MINEKYIELIAKLRQKTEEKKLIWQKSSAQDEFKLQMAKGSLTVNYYTGNYNEPDSVLISIYNDNGDRIEVIDIEDGSTEYEPAQELYRTVRRAYYKVDETINSIFNELDTNEIIGTVDKRPEDNDDDLPF